MHNDLVMAWKPSCVANIHILGWQHGHQNAECFYCQWMLREEPSVAVEPTGARRRSVGRYDELYFETHLRMAHGDVHVSIGT